MTLLRAQLRSFVAGQMQAAIPAVPVLENRALATYAGALPVIIVTTPRERKESLVRGGPQFNTTVLLSIATRIVSSSDNGAVASLEALLEQIEAATLSNQALIDQLQQFSSVHYEQQVVATGGDFVAEGTVHIECEMYEDYRDPPASPFLDIRATVTLQAATETVDVPLPQ